ncbi:hypothetical protein MRX96_055064 [Rhipicephalus microplus]
MIIIIIIIVRIKTITHLRAPLFRRSTRKQASAAGRKESPSTLGGMAVLAPGVGAKKAIAKLSKSHTRRASFDRGLPRGFSPRRNQASPGGDRGVRQFRWGEDAGPDVVAVHLLLSRATTQTQVARSTESPREKLRTDRTEHTPPFPRVNTVPTLPLCRNYRTSSR